MKQHSILLVDDDAILVKGMKAILEAAGHKVTGVLNGTKALEELEAGKFDLVITDVFFPGKDGIEVILERSKSDSHAHVIALSGEGKYATDHYLRLVRKLGADVILKKPFGAEQLLAAVASAFPS